MYRFMKHWVFWGVMLSLAAYAIAEDITLTTFYPSPRGVYSELRVGSATFPATTGKLHVVLPTAEVNRPAFQVDDQDSLAETTPFVIDQNGLVGIGTAAPLADLHIRGANFPGGGGNVGGLIIEGTNAGEPTWAMAYAQNNNELWLMERPPGFGGAGTWPIRMLFRQGAAGGTGGDAVINGELLIVEQATPPTPLAATTRSLTINKTDNLFPVGIDLINRGTRNVDIGFTRGATLLPTYILGIDAGDNDRFKISTRFFGEDALILSPNRQIMLGQNDIPFPPSARLTLACDPGTGNNCDLAFKAPIGALPLSQDPGDIVFLNNDDSQKARIYADPNSPTGLILTTNPLNNVQVWLNELGQLNPRDGIKVGNAFGVPAPPTFEPNPAYYQNQGFIAFRDADPGGAGVVSEDFIGYRDGSFFLADSLGGDPAQPGLVVGGPITAGTLNPLPAVGGLGTPPILQVITPANANSYYIFQNDANVGFELRSEGGGTPYIDFSNGPAGSDYDIRLRLRDDVRLRVEAPLAAPGTAIFQVDGNIEVQGQYNCGVLSDIAENIPVQDKQVRKPESGDVVIVDADHDESVALTNQSYDPLVAGVISTKPGVLLGSELEGEAVALSGRVPTKVIAENGPIRRGDLLVTASKPGYAMRGDPDVVRPGMVIGKAMGELLEGEGTVVVLVNLQ